jgi:hypothetical protein
MAWDHRGWLVGVLNEAQAGRIVYRAVSGEMDASIKFPLYADSRLWSMLYVIGKKPSDEMVSYAQLLEYFDKGIACIEREIWAIDNPEEQARIEEDRRILKDAKESLWVVRGLKNPRKVVEKMLTLLPERGETCDLVLR